MNTARDRQKIKLTFWQTVLALTTLLVMMSTACNLPFAGGSPTATNTKMATATLLPATATVAEAVADSTITPTATATADASQSQRIPGLDAGVTLVWWLSDGSLVMEQPGGKLVPVAVNVEIQVDWGMPGSAEQFSFAPGVLAYPDLTRGYLMAANREGQTWAIPGLEPTKFLVGAALSPDGKQVCWMYDVTEVKPNPYSEEDACPESKGCVGRVYDIYLSDAKGENSAKLTTYIEKGDGYPQVILNRWRADSRAIFLQQKTVGILDAYYPPPRADFLELDASNGKIVRRRPTTFGADTFISPDGNWLAWNNDVDNKLLVITESRSGDHYQVPQDSSSIVIAHQLIFSPDSQQLYWLELTQGETIEDITAIAVHSLDLGSGSSGLVADIQPVAKFYRDNLPFLTGWLNDTLLLVSTKHDTQVLDVKNQEWVEFEWPPLNDTAILLGAIYP